MLEISTNGATGSAGGGDRITRYHPEAVDALDGLLRGGTDTGGASGLAGRPDTYKSKAG